MIVNPLLSMQFDSSGCLDKTNVVNLGGVTFDQQSSLGFNGLRCAYFQPYDDCAGFYIKNGNVIKTQITKNVKDFSIYFKYKIHKDWMEDKVPIISFRPTVDSKSIYTGKYTGCDTTMLLYIQDKRFFAFRITEVSPSNGFYYFTRDVEETFDGNWHLFCMNRMNGLYRFFIDGLLCTRYAWRENYNPNIEMEDEIFIGWSREGNIIHSFTNGCIDDFNILDKCTYVDTFIPPTNYWWFQDIITNYRRDEFANVDKLEPEVEEKIILNAEHSHHNLNEVQYGFVPRRLHLTWNVVNDYFEDYDYHIHTKHSNEMAFNITQCDTTFETWDTEYFDMNYLTGRDRDQLMTIVLFVNGYFVKMSKIRIVKSHDWYTFFIDRSQIRNPDNIYRFEIVLVPFPVIYEEDIGENPAYNVLYCFNENGEFTTSGAITFYYFDTIRAPNYMGKFAIDYIDLTERATDADFFHSVWHYGVFQTKRICGKGAYMYFLAWDNGWVKPGDNIVLYKNTEMVDPSKYEIFGYDLLYFYDYEKDLGNPNDLFSMQVITDGRVGKDWLFLDNTKMKTVQVKATVDQQSVFEIPKVYDETGIQYKEFYLFKEQFFIYDPDKYDVDYDENIIRFQNRDDFCEKDTVLNFVFIRLNMPGHHGLKYMKPVYLYPDKTTNLTTTTITRPAAGGTTTKTLTVSRIKIPEYEGLIFNKNNFFLFADGDLIVPPLYTLDYETNTETNVTTTFITFRDEDITEKLNNCGNIVLCLLRIVDPMEEPITLRDKFISKQINKGRRFILYDLDIPKWIKITLDNFVCFDTKGKYVPDTYGYVYSMNIIKHLYTSNPIDRHIKYISVVWHKYYSVYNYSLNTIPYNDQFVRNYIKLYQEFYELDYTFEEFMSDFDVNFRSDKHYAENLARALDYQVAYNQSMFVTLYEKLATVTRNTYDPRSINKKLTELPDGTYSYELFRDDYKTNHYRTFLMFFENGKLTDWNKDIEYSNNTAVVTLDQKLNKSSLIESLETHNMQNFLLPVIDESGDMLVSGVPDETIIRYHITIQFTVGDPFHTDFTFFFAVEEWMALDIMYTFKVIDPIPTPIINTFYKDVLEIVFDVGLPYEYDIPITFKTERILIGVPFERDPNKKYEQYEIYFKAIISGDWSFDIPFEFEIDDY